MYMSLFQTKDYENKMEAYIVVANSRQMWH
jgi:hypothetical protein